MGFPEELFVLPLFAYPEPSVISTGKVLRKGTFAHVCFESGLIHPLPLISLLHMDGQKDRQTYTSITFPHII